MIICNANAAIIIVEAACSGSTIKGQERKRRTDNTGGLRGVIGPRQGRPWGHTLLKHKWVKGRDRERKNKGNRMYCNNFFCVNKILFLFE